MNRPSGILFITLSLLLTTFTSADPVITKAQVVLCGSSIVKGTLNLTESSDQPGVRIVGQVTGLSPGKHGFHIHQFGDIFTKGCNSTGPHFNPIKVSHGPREADALHRHAGDEGNIIADADGIANIDFVEKMVTLNCQSRNSNNVVGRAFVVHEKEDDLGFGGNEGSITTGNAGGRLACGIIALAP